MTPQDALVRFRDTAALWNIRQARGAEVVDAAVEALLAGVDGQWLAVVAGVSAHAPEPELREAVQNAFAELGLPWHPEGSLDALEAVLHALAARTAAGELHPRELARWAHRSIGHDRLPAAEQLVLLDDRYDYGPDDASVDAEVLAWARALTGSR
ncbi:hypothetical protein [Pseudonocardia sp. TRM90224]|uniref:hypothetical protein n=1 Tax=Pseudonocardia sp. TRM90224 TaxID=2812678 RepID=UPI001E560F56|nr:hypothetical protein [Pseudonocardia sp. TRM90224]